MNLKPGDRVAWYRYDDHLTPEQRYGTIVSVDRIDDGLATVCWDAAYRVDWGRTTEVFARYLEPEAEVREWFATRQDPTQEA